MNIYFCWFGTPLEINWYWIFLSSVWLLPYVWRPMLNNSIMKMIILHSNSQIYCLVAWFDTHLHRWSVYIFINNQMKSSSFDVFENGLNFRQIIIIFLKKQGKREHTNRATHVRSENTHIHFQPNHLLWQCVYSKYMVYNKLPVVRLTY